MKSSTPKRIICTVPSITELLYHLGLEDEVVGITKFCVHPKEWYSTKTRIGGTKNLNLTKIKQLQPDLIIANKEENVKEQIEDLQKVTNVLVTDIETLNDAIAMIITIGKHTKKLTAARKIATRIEQSFATINNLFSREKVAYFIWQNPYMTIGGDTFIHHMLTSIGLNNAFASKKRYPIVTIDDIKKTQCNYLLLSSEPYPFKQKHIVELQKQLPNTKVVLVNGEIFSWYGSKLLESVAYFKELHKELYSNTKK